LIHPPLACGELVREGRVKDLDGVFHVVDLAAVARDGGAREVRRARELI